MAEDMPKEPPPHPAAEPRHRIDPPDPAAGPRHRIDPPEDFATSPGEIDMSFFEELFDGPCAAGPEYAVNSPLASLLHEQPALEWAVRWDDGRLTRVPSQAAALLVEGGNGDCEVICRIVGSWGPP